jgi:hypothetical protein
MSKPYTFPSQALIICLSIATKNATTSLCHAPVRNESNKIRITNIVVAVVSATFALLRLGYKVISFGFEDLGYDDYAVLAATVMGVPTVVIIDRGIVPNGLAMDVWTVPFDHITNFVRWLFILESLYFLLIAMVKLTLLFFFLRIFPKPVIRKLLWATIIFDVLYGVVFAIISIFQCQPISFYWVRNSSTLYARHVLTQCSDSLGWRRHRKVLEHQRTCLVKRDHQYRSGPLDVDLTVV